LSFIKTSSGERDVEDQEVACDVQVETRVSMRVLSVNNINEVAGVYGKGLQERNHRVTLYQPSLVGGSAALPVKLAMLPERIFDMRHIVGQLNTRHFDVVHIHWASYGALGLVSKIPFIVHCHGTDVRERLKSPLFRSLLSPIFQRATAVLCITPDLLPIVRTLRSDTIFLPSPIDTDHFAPEKECQCSLSRLRTLLLFARLDPIKGADSALQGIARFAQRNADVRVQVLDWGPLREHYKQQYAERFEFVPRVAPHEVARLLHSADIIVGQLHLGALGLSELQAMSCAKPVIASFIYEDAYPNLPPICQATTAEEVDQHLEHLFRHPEEGAALGRRAREWVIANHDYRVLAARLEMLYLQSLC
jgi:glycosyltransferase involved in cell wall biosynthesis